MKAQESYVRSNAAEAFGRLGSEKAVDPLIKVLTTDKESYVRWRAAHALGKMGDNRAIEPLKEALKDEGEWIIGKVKDRAFAALETISRKTHQRITIQQN